MQTMTSIFFTHLESAKEGPPWPDWLIWAEHRNVVSELWMPFSMTECFCKWSYSGCCPEAFSVFRLQPLLVAIEKGNTKLKIRVSLCISFAKTHSEKYPFRIWMHQNRWNLDNFPPCVHISITRLFHIHKSEGSYIMQTAIRRNAVSSLRTCVTTPWGPLSIAKRKKGGCCLGMHICSVYGPSASFIIPNWHIFLDLFLLLQRSIQRLFSQWGSKALGFFLGF